MTISVRTTGSVELVNTTVGNNQFHQHVAGLTGGGYVVVWESEGQESSSGVYGQRYDAGGLKVGDEFHVNTRTAGHQTEPRVAALPGGGYVVTWYDHESPEAPIYSQRYDSAGARVGAEIATAPGPGTTGNVTSVAGLADGGYVLAWNAYAAGTSSIRLQRFDSSGGAVGPLVETPAQVNIVSPIRQSVAADATGGYLFAWSDATGLHFQHFDASGAASPLSHGGAPTDWAVASLAGGGYVASWTDAENHLHVQRLDSAGQLSGAEWLGDRGYGLESVTHLADGGFLVSFYDDGLFAQAFDSAGAPVGHEILVAEGLARDAEIAGLQGGGFVAIWYLNGAPLAGADVFHRLYSPSGAGGILTAAIEVADGDGADDTFVVSAAALNAGDRISGGGGQDAIQLTTTGTNDFTGVFVAGVERIVGTAGDDTLIFEAWPEGELVLDSGGGRDTLRLLAGTDLSTLPTLVGDWTVTGPGGPVTFQITGPYASVRLDAGGAEITIDASTYALTADERAALFADGVTQISQPGGYTFTAPTTAVIPGGAAVVNTIGGDHVSPDIANLGDGYVIVWTAYDQGLATTYVQRFDDAGGKSGAEIHLTSNDFQTAGVNAVDGGFVVTWLATSGSYGSRVYSQQFDASGQKVGGQNIVAGSSWGDFRDISAVAVTGGYVVGWSQQIPGVEGYEVFGQRYDDAGAKVGDAFKLNHAWAGDQRDLAMASLSSGGFVATWKVAATGEIFVQRFDAAGAKVGFETSFGATGVLDYQTVQYDATVAGLANGGFVVTWATREGQQQWTVHSQRFDDNGALVGTETRLAVNEWWVEEVSVKAAPDGGYVLVWTEAGDYDYGSNPVTPDIYAQRYDGNGQAIGQEIRLNPVQAGRQESGAATILDDGSLVSVWAWPHTMAAGQTDIETSRLLYVDFLTLTAGADTLAANAAPRLVTTAAAAFTAADSLVGGTAIDRLDLSAAGVLDLTAPAVFSGFEIVAGSGGDDRFIVSTARLSGITNLFGGAGDDVLQISAAGALDLSTVTLNSIEIIEGSSGDDTFTIDPNRMAGVTAIYGGVGFDVVQLAGPREVSLDGLDWNGVELIRGSSGNDVFRLSHLPTGVGQIDGGLGVDTVDHGAATAGIVMTTAYLNVETVYGGAFDDVLLGADGADNLYGGEGDDELRGGAGADKLTGGAGSNLIYGGDGDDVITAVGVGLSGSAADSNQFYGDAGNDNIAGGSGNDVLDGGEGNDVLNGDLGDDVLWGGGGNDGLNGAAGDDILDGGLGADTLRGGAGNDILIGGEGGDNLLGEVGEDQLYGGAGNDVLRDGDETTNRDFLFGGAGNDTYYVNSSLTGPLDLVYEGGTDPDIAAGTNDIDIIRSSGSFFWDYYGVGEVLYVNTNAGSQLIGGTNSQTIYGANGYDQIMVYGGSNRVDAGRGVDAISFGLYGLDESYDGVNTLVMKAGSGMDYVFEFESGVDKVDLSAFNFGITGAQVLAQAINIDNAGTDSDYCYFYLTSAGGVDNFVVFMGLLSSQLQASDFIT